MGKNIKKLSEFSTLIAIFFAVFSFNAFAIDDCPCHTTILNNPAPGYILTGPLNTLYFSLMDNTGNLVYFDTLNTFGGVTNLQVQPNGLLTFYDTKFGKYYAVNKNYAIVDSFECVHGYGTDMHEFRWLTNGHYFLLGIDLRIIDMSELIDGGNTAAHVIGFVLQEFDENKNLVFEWNSFDHFNITDATPDINLTYPTITYVHCNSIDIDTDGNILLSSRFMDEITKINRTTGAIMWRLGGKYCKNNQFRFTNDTIQNFWGFSHQHYVRRLPNGNILLYDNGNMRVNKFSRAVEYSINESARTITKVWEYRNNPDVFTGSQGSAQRLSNGNTLIGWGGYNDISTPMITEVRPDGTKTFEMVCDPVSFYRAFRQVYNMTAVTKTINASGSYNFNETGNETGINFNLTSVSGSGQATVEKHNYKPQNLIFNDSTPNITYPYRWVINRTGIANVTGTIKFNLNTITGILAPAKVIVYKRNTEGSGAFIELTTSYNSSANEIQANFSGFGEIILSCDTTALAVPVLSAPANNSYGAPIQGTISWHSVARASSYRLQVSTNQNFTTTIYNESGITSLQFNYERLDNNTKYYWRVKAYNSKDSSLWSNVWNFTTVLAKPALSLPENNSYGVFVIGGQLRWNGINGATSYRIQLSINSDFNSNIIDRSGIVNLLTTYDTLDNYKQYYWRVKAINTVDSSAWSDTWSFKTKLKSPQLEQPVNNSKKISVDGFLFWKSVDSATTYRLQISLAPGFDSTAYDINGITKLNFQFLNLIYNTKYYWRVKAVNSLDSSAWSSIWNFTTKIPEPTLLYPKNNASNVSVADTLRWTEVKEATSYRIQIAENKNFDLPIYDQGGIKEVNLIINILSHNTHYYWRVNAINGIDTSEWSEAFNFITVVGESLAAPVLLSPASFSYKVPIKGTLTWNKVLYATKYWLQVSQYPDFSQLTIEKKDLAVQSGNYDSLFKYTKYYWRVCAYNTIDTSEWSQIWEFTTRLAAPFLKNPSNSSLNQQLEGELSWNSVSGAETYWVQLSAFPDFSICEVGESGLNALSKNYSNLVDNTKYYWHVRACNSNDTSQWSNTRQFTTKSAFYIDPPQLLEPVDEINGAPVNGTLNWQSVPLAENYYIQLSNDSEFENLITDESNLNENYYQYNDLDYYTKYFWRVSSVKKDGMSDWSSVRSFTTEIGTPVPFNPANNSINIPIKGTLTWLRVNGAGNYHVQISRTQDFNNPDVEFFGIYENFILYKDLTAFCDYFWRVRAINVFDTSAWSPAWKFTTDDTYGVTGENSKDNSIISIYPNPISSSAVFEIYLPAESYMSLKIYNQLGVEIATAVDSYLPQGSNKIPWSCKGISDGIYYYAVLVGQSTKSGKIIILR